MLAVFYEVGFEIGLIAVHEHQALQETFDEIGLLLGAGVPLEFANVQKATVFKDLGSLDVGFSDVDLLVREFEEYVDGDECVQQGVDHVVRIFCIPSGERDEVIGSERVGYLQKIGVISESVGQGVGKDLDVRVVWNFSHDRMFHVLRVVEQSGMHATLLLQDGQDFFLFIVVDATFLQEEILGSGSLSDLIMILDLLVYRKIVWIGLVMICVYLFSIFVGVGVCIVYDLSILWD